MNSTEIERVEKFDFHIHTKSSADGYHSFQEMVNFANKNGVSEIAFTDHNTIIDLRRLWRQYDADFNMPLCISGVDIIPAVEVTCRVSDVPNIKGNSSKVHLLIYAPNLSEHTALSKVLALKHENDQENDIGILKWILKHKVKNGNVTAREINKFINDKKKVISGYSSISFDDAVEFLQQKKITPFKSARELSEARQECPKYGRLNLEAKDIIALAHDSGAMCILAHPAVNLHRTNQPRALVESLLDSGLDGFEMKYNYAEDGVSRMIASVVSERKHQPRKHRPANRIVYTAGSDSHMITSENTIGFVTNSDEEKCEITYDDVYDFVEELDSLAYARQEGKKTHRIYPNITDEEINKIVNKYTKKFDELRLLATSQVYRTTNSPVSTTSKQAKKQAKKERKKIKRKKMIKKRNKKFNKAKVQSELTSSPVNRDERLMYEEFVKSMEERYRQNDDDNIMVKERK